MRATLAPRVLIFALSLVLAVAASPFSRAQEKAGELVSRDELVDAIADYAASGGCKTRRDIFGAAFDAACKQEKLPDSDDDERIRMVDRLDRLSERALIELCRRNKIAECEKPRETSKGRPILTFESAFGIEFNSPRAAWSPDGRLLLLDNLNPPMGEARLLDVAAGRLLDPPLYSGPLLRDVAWSPDGGYIALSERRRSSPEQRPPLGAIRLVSSATLKESASISASDTGCDFGLSEGMAFTADAKSLWVPCSWGPSRVAKAIKLKVPELAVEESFVPVFPSPGWSESYWEEEILRFKDDLVVMARFRNPTLASGLRTAVQSFSLRTKQPLHQPIYVSGGRLADDLSGVYVGSELWSTASGQRVATAVKASGRSLGDPSRLPQLSMHVEVKAGASSRHSMVMVVDSAAGATVQELGPIPTAIKALVAPNGARVAIMGFREIRFYSVSP